MSDDVSIDSAEGSVYLEVHFKLVSESGREKHIDLEGQGKFMAEGVRNFLIDSTRDAVDIEIVEVKYWGTQIPERR